MRFVMTELWEIREVGDGEVYQKHLDRLMVETVSEEVVLENHAHDIFAQTLRRYGEY